MMEIYTLSGKTKIPPRKKKKPLMKMLVIPVTLSGYAWVKYSLKFQKFQNFNIVLTPLKKYLNFSHVLNKSLFFLFSGTAQVSMNN